MTVKTSAKPIIGIVGGKGKMGKLFADFFTENGLKVLISDTDTKLSNEQLAQKADIVIVSVSMGSAEKVIKQIAPFVREGALLADITSIKQRPMQAMASCKGEVLGLHPMFGASNPIPGQLILYCESQNQPVPKVNSPKAKQWSQWLLQFFKKNNVSLVKLSAEEHDQMMAYAQGIIHFSEIVFAHALCKLGQPVKEILKFTGIASDIRVLLAGRIIFQDPNLYGNIQIMNDKNVPVMKQFLSSAEELMKIVEKKDLKKFTNYFEKVKTFFGKYGKESYSESSWIIDQVLNARRSNKLISKKTPVSKIVLNKNKSVAVLGPEGTFSGIAAQKFIKKSATNTTANLTSNLSPVYYNSIEQVFGAVANNGLKWGIVPVENKIHGSVREVLDNLFKQNVKVVGEVILPIQHCLMVLPQATKKDIQKIISHQQALAQCNNFLNKNFPKRIEESVASTTTGVQQLLVTQNKELAVIGPREIAEKNGLKIITENIEDEKGNETRFFLIQKGSFTANDVQNSFNNISIAFHFGENMPGTLFSVFEVFAKFKIDLTKIESRPTSKKFGNYVFYLDFKGKFSDSHIQKALKEVSKKVKKLKLLGAY